jgi:diguanylate cyclase (GGDEF)-like protein
LLFISLIAAVILLSLTVLRCRSEKKNYFIFCLIGMLFYVLGNYFEVTSSSAESALQGVKFMYVGACFMPPLVFLFVLDYCEFKLSWKLRTVLRIVLLGIAFAAMMVVWSTERTGLMYAAYSYASGTTVHGLQVDAPGPAYYPILVFLTICIIASVAAIAIRIVGWNKRYRLPLFLLMLAAGAPLLTNFAYVFTTYIFKTSLHGVNLTPFALILTNLLVYMNVLRYDLFDFTPRAYSASLDMIRDGLVLLDADMHFMSSNNVGRELFPGLKDLSKGDPITKLENWPVELSHLRIDADPEKDPYAERRNRDGKEREGEDRQNIRFRFGDAGDSEIRFFNAWIHTVILGQKSLGRSILIQDITDNVILMQKLEEAAFTDGLTGLFNRRRFMELAIEGIEKSKQQLLPYSVLMFDLDFFKKINDTYGHLAGDEMLRCVAKEVRRTVRATDIFGRYGGEEFVIFMSGADAKTALKLAERVRKCVEVMNCRFEGNDLSVTCSVGSATSEGALDLEQIVERADAALYEAKQTGRNKVCVFRDSGVATDEA